MMALINLRTMEASGIVLRAELQPVSEIEKKLGYEQTAALIRHAASEQTRLLTDNWETGEIILAAALGISLYFATQRRILPLVLCGIMLILTLFQHGALSPELAYRGRDTDFPPGSTQLALITRVWALRQVYYGVEIAKLLAGGVLASYLFVFRTSRRGNSLKEHRFQTVKAGD